MILVVVVIWLPSLGGSGILSTDLCDCRSGGLQVPGLRATISPFLSPSYPPPSSVRSQHFVCLIHFGNTRKQFANAKPQKSLITESPPPSFSPFRWAYHAHLLFLPMPKGWRVLPSLLWVPKPSHCLQLHRDYSLEKHIISYNKHVQQAIIFLL